MVKFIVVGENDGADFGLVWIVFPTPFNLWKTHHWDGFGYVVFAPETIIFIRGYVLVDIVLYQAIILFLVVLYLIEYRIVMKNKSSE